MCLYGLPHPRYRQCVRPHPGNCQWPRQPKLYIHQTCRASPCGRTATSISSLEDLDRKIDLVIDQLLARFKIQCQKKVRNYPFLMGEGVWIDSEKLDPDDSVAEVLKHGTLTCGFIGLGPNA